MNVIQIINLNCAFLPRQPGFGAVREWDRVKLGERSPGEKEREREVKKRAREEMEEQQREEREREERTRDRKYARRGGYRGNNNGYGPVLTLANTLYWCH